MDAEAVKEKYTGEAGSQKVLNSEYNVGIVGDALFLLTAREARWDLKASSTLSPPTDIGLGADSDETSVCKNISGRVRDNSVQLSRSSDGSMGNGIWAGGRPAKDPIGGADIEPGQ